MSKSDKILSSFSEPDQQKVLEVIKAERAKWIKELNPEKDAFGLRRLPRETDDINSPLLKQFNTEKHTYTIIGDEGIGFDRYTTFQKRSMQRGFAKGFQALIDELNNLKMNIAKEADIGKIRSNSIIHIQGMQDAVADFGNEQFDAALWLCTLFILRDDEKVSEYSEVIAEQKIKDWSNYGYSELDFFLLSGQTVTGYGKAFQSALQRNTAAKRKYLDVIATGGRLLEKTEQSKAD